MSLPLHPILSTSLPLVARTARVVNRTLPFLARTLSFRVRTASVLNRTLPFRVRTVIFLARTLPFRVRTLLFLARKIVFPHSIQRSVWLGKGLYEIASYLAMTDVGWAFDSAQAPEAFVIPSR